MSRIFLLISVATFIFQVQGIARDEPLETTEINVTDSFDPCVNYLDYVCQQKNLTEEPPKSRNQTRLATESVMLEYPAKVKLLSDAERKLVEFRNICNYTTVEDLRQFVRSYSFPDSIGAWPVFEKDWKSDKFNLQKAIARMNSIFFPVIFTFRFKNNRRTSKSYISIKLRLSSALLHDDTRAVKNEQLEKLIDNADEVIEDGVIVENALKNAINDTEQHIRLRTDFAGLKKEIPEIDWNQQIEMIYGLKVPDDFFVEVEQLKELKSAIAIAYALDPKVMANYIFYRFATSIPEPDDEIVSFLFRPVVYQMLLKEYYPDILRGNLRSMLQSFIKTLNRAVNIFNETEENEEHKILDFIQEDLLPDVNDEIFDELYKDIKISDTNCYSSAFELLQILLKWEYRKFFERKIDKLHYLEHSLMDMVVNRVPHYVKRASPYKFEALVWKPLKSYISNLNALDDVGDSVVVINCLENQLNKTLNDTELSEALQIQIYAAAYWDWAGNNVDLVNNEDAKYGINSKTLLLELLTDYHCENVENEGTSNFLAYLSNLEEFSILYNCSTGSTFNPKNKCSLWELRNKN